MTNVEAQMGRPPLKKGKHRNKRVVVLFTDAELAEIDDFIESPEGEEYDGRSHLGVQSMLDVVRAKRKPEGE